MTKRPLEAESDAALNIARLAAQVRAMSTTPELLQQVLDILPCAVIIVDACGNFLQYNAAATLLTGLGPISTPFTEWNTIYGIFQRDGKTLLKADEICMVRSLKGETVVNDIYCLRNEGHPDGSWIKISSSPLFDEDGQIVGAVIAAFDIGEEYATIHALESAKGRFEALLHSSNDAIILTNGAMEICIWNRAAESLFGLSQDQMIGHPIHEVLEVSIYDALSDSDDSAPGSVLSGRGTNPAGEMFPCEVSFAYTSRGDDLYYTFLVRDITKQENLKAQLVQAQKLEAIGQLAAGVAHEINTPTQYVNDNTHFLRDEFENLSRVLQSYGTLLAAAQSGTIDPALLEQVSRTVADADLEFLLEEIPTAIAQSLEGLERISKIVRSMKALSHPGAADEKQETDINELIRNTVTVSTNAWKYVAELHTELDPDLPQVMCLPNELSQVILNIIVNGAHAIESVLGENPTTKGRLGITTSTLRQGVEIRISDTGTGIPPEAQAKIFNPFFTTKAVGKGTGQGLSIAHSIVADKHQGTLSFESSPGAGTTFIIWIPRADSAGGATPHD